MSKRRIIPPEVKVKAVEEYLNGNCGFRKVAKKYHVGATPFRRWIDKYRSFGKEELLSPAKQSYSEEFKQMVVNAYLNGEGSQRILAIKYKLSHERLVSNWLSMYNGHEKNNSPQGGKTDMAKGRKTTFDERVEIVNYCISHDHNYNETAAKYGISYQQARNYTAKYEEKGIDGLQDNRGKRKPEEKMTELEKLRTENRLLRAEKRRAEMEISFLKKLEELERGWY